MEPLFRGSLPVASSVSTALRKPGGHIIINCFLGWGSVDHLTFIQNNGFICQAQNSRHIMADEQDRTSFFGNIVHLAQAFALEFSISDCQHLIHYQDIRLQMGCYRESQPQVHSAGIALDGGIDKFLNPGKIYDLIKFPFNGLAVHTQDSAIEIDILPTGQFGVEAGYRLPATIPHAR